MHTETLLTPSNADAAQLRAQARRRLQVPAIFLIVIWSLTIVTNIMSALITLLGGGMTKAALDELQQAAEANPDLTPFVEMYEKVLQFQTQAIWPMTLVILALAILSIMGAVRMLQLRSYGLAMTAAIVSMIPCLSSCCCLALPFGIWCTVALSTTAVKQQFH